MNILIYYKFFPNIGGVERVITILSNSFIELGHSVGVVSFQQNVKESPYVLDKNVKMFSLPNDQVLGSSENVLTLCQIIREGSYQILFNHDSVFDSIDFVGKVKKKSGCKLITLHHGAIYMPKESFLSNLNSSSKVKHRILYNIGGFSYLLKKIKVFLHHQRNIDICDKYICLCDAYRNQLHRKNKTSVIYNPLSYPYILGESEKRDNNVLFVGRIDEKIKRITIILDAWRMLNLSDWVLMLVGDGPDRQFIESYISSHDIMNVKVEGFQQPKDYYRNSKIFLMTSATEGYPMTISEAKQFGCVPIAMDSFASIHECIENDVDGYIVKNNSMCEFIDRLRTLIDDECKLMEMSRSAIVNSRERNATLIAKQWISLFETLIK